MTENAPRREICVWYRIPPGGTRTASVTEASRAEDGATGRQQRPGGPGQCVRRASGRDPAPSITETTTATSPG